MPGNTETKQAIAEFKGLSSQLEHEKPSVENGFYSSLLKVLPYACFEKKSKKGFFTKLTSNIVNQLRLTQSPVANSNIVFLYNCIIKNRWEKIPDPLFLSTDHLDLLEKSIHLTIIVTLMLQNMAERNFELCEAEFDALLRICERYQDLISFCYYSDYQFPDVFQKKCLDFISKKLLNFSRDQFGDDPDYCWVKKTCESLFKCDFQFSERVIEVFFKDPRHVLHAKHIGNILGSMGMIRSSDLLGFKGYSAREWVSFTMKDQGLVDITQAKQFAKQALHENNDFLRTILQPLLCRDVISIVLAFSDNSIFNYNKVSFMFWLNQCYRLNFTFFERAHNSTDLIIFDVGPFLDPKEIVKIQNSSKICFLTLRLPFKYRDFNALV